MLYWRLPTNMIRTIFGVYELLERGASQNELADYLREIEVDRMELVLSPEAKRDAAASSLKSLAQYFTEAAT